MAQFLQLLANGLVTGSIIAIAAVGLSLDYGILKLVNFAHGEYLTFGAYAAPTSARLPLRGATASPTGGRGLENPPRGRAPPGDPWTQTRPSDGGRNRARPRRNA